MSVEYTVALRSTDAGGVLYENTFAVKSDPSGPDVDEPTDANVAAAIKAWLLTDYHNCLAPGYTWIDIVCRGILGHDGEATESVNVAGALGGGTGLLPKEVCMIASVKTGHVGRTGRGHMAIPSPRASSFLADATNWLGSGSAYWDNVGTFASTLLAGHDFTYAGGVLTAHLSMRLWSRKDGLTRDVTGIVRRPAVRWLRSRSTAP